MSRRPDPSGLIGLHDRGRRRGRGRRRSRLGVGALLAAYVCGLAAMIGTFVVSPALTVVAYPIVGAVLSRFISARAVWIREKASIRNLAEAKTGFVLRWPIAMPVFIAQLAAARNL